MDWEAVPVGSQYQGVVRSQTTGEVFYRTELYDDPQTAGEMAREWMLFGAEAEAGDLFAEI